MMKNKKAIIKKLAKKLAKQNVTEQGRCPVIDMLAVNCPMNCCINEWKCWINWAKEKIK